MVCAYCGCEIPRGKVVCPRCHREVQMVPDYSPLDDYLAQNVKDSIHRKKNDSRNSAAYRAEPKPRSASGNNGSGQLSQEELRRRRAEKRRRRRMQKLRRMLLLFLIVLISVSAACIALYVTSYSYTVKRGYSALHKKDYVKAEERFQSAISKNEERVEAYVGLSDMYVAQLDTAKAEQIYLDAMKKHGGNADLYSACCEFYLSTSQEMKIPALLDPLDEKLLKKLKDYVVKKPSFSLDEKQVYDDVQQVSLEAEEKTDIYFTTDGSDVSASSEKYKEPLQLSEGVTQIRAIAVNGKGVPSEVTVKEYTIEYPIADAPAVSPSTGQYQTAEKIEIKVPENYTAYYTTDGSDPGPGSTKYEGPVDMPEGETLFKAILINNKGRTSDITTRNYVRE